MDIELNPAEQDAAVEKRAGSDKEKQILEGARQVFLAKGFDAASMNDIARVAGVSKGTLYVYFDSKEALFADLIRKERTQQAERICRISDENPDVAAVLFSFGRSLLTMLVEPAHLAQVRTVIAAVPKFPQIGQAFYESGPRHGLDRLAAYFARQTEAGRLDTPEPRIAASHFVQLCQGDIYKQVLFGITDQITAKDIDHAVQAAVDVFMKAYGPAAASSR
jgi:AcrR family transcriptional regulator